MFDDYRDTCHTGQRESNLGGHERTQTAESKVVAVRFLEAILHCIHAAYAQGATLGQEGDFLQAGKALLTAVRMVTCGIEDECLESAAAMVA